MNSIFAKSMKRHFLDIGEETRRTQLFESLPESRRADMSSRLALDFEEDPILVTFLEPEGCLILSMRRAIIDLGTGHQSLPFSTIESVGVDHTAERRMQRDKALWRTLRVELVSGTTLHLEMEPGRAFWGVLNVFKSLVDRTVKS